MPNDLQLQRREPMLNLEYHKGSFCGYTTVFCQEGYCSECEIYLKMIPPPKIIDRRIMLTFQEAVLISRRDPYLDKSA